MRSADPEVSSPPGLTFPASLEGLVTVFERHSSFDQLEDNIATVKI
jgi:hypothetical protein